MSDVCTLCMRLDREILCMITPRAAGGGSSLERRINAKETVAQDSFADIPLGHSPDDCARMVVIVGRFSPCIAGTNPGHRVAGNLVPHKPCQHWDLYSGSFCIRLLSISPLVGSQRLLPRSPKLALGVSAGAKDGTWDRKPVSVSGNIIGTP